MLVLEPVRLVRRDWVKTDLSLPAGYMEAKLEGDRLAESGQWEDAKLELEKARELFDGFCAAESKDLDERIHGVYRQIIDKNLALGDELKAEEDLEAAREKYQIAFDLVSDDYERDEIRVRMELDSEEEAASQNSPLQQLFREADNTPDSPEALYNLATELAIEGYVDQAVVYLERVIALTPDDPDPRFRHANALSDLGRHEEAKKAYETAREKGYDEADVAYRLGRLARERGDTKAALAEYEACLLKKADHVACLRELAHLHEVEERFPQSIERYQAVLKLDDEDALATYTLGKLYLGTGELEEARFYLRKARDLGDEVYTMLAEERLAELEDAS